MEIEQFLKGMRQNEQWQTIDFNTSESNRLRGGVYILCSIKYDTHFLPMVRVNSLDSAEISRHQLLDRGWGRMGTWVAWSQALPVTEGSLTGKYDAGHVVCRTWNSIYDSHLTSRLRDLCSTQVGWRDSGVTFVFGVLRQGLAQVRHCGECLCLGGRGRRPWIQGQPDLHT